MRAILSYIDEMREVGFGRLVGWVTRLTYNCADAVSGAATATAVSKSARRQSLVERFGDFIIGVHPFPRQEIRREEKDGQRVL